MQKVKFSVARVNLADLKVAVAYQRMIKKAHVKQIVNNFNPEAISAIKVAKRANGSMYIIDGQHQAQALMQLGYTVWPCQVTASRGRAHEAELFRICNSAKTRKQVTPLELYRALLVEGDPKARACHASIKDHGFVTGNVTQWPTIRCIGCVQKLSDLGVLDETLAMIVDAWGDTEDVSALHIGVISGLGQWIYDMWDSDKWTDAVQDKMIARMSTVTPKRIRMQIQDRVKDNGYTRARAGAEVFTRLFNSRKKREQSS
jgi:hypothetical protein